MKIIIIILRKFRCQYPSSSVTRLYLQRKEGGRGLINIFNLCRTQEENIRNKFLCSNDDLIKSVIRADEGYTPLNLSCHAFVIPKKELKPWKENILHGKFPNLLDEDHIDRSASLQWLADGSLYPETEGFIMAIQNRIIRTKNYEKHILKLNVTDKCRRCDCMGESIEHIMAGCPTLSENAYLGRHNQVAKLIHQQLGIKYGLLDTKTPPYYKYQPVPVVESGKYILYWDRPVLTDRTIAYNRPDILLIDFNTSSGILIDIAVPLTHNIKRTEAEKKNKYEELAWQIKEIWKLDRVSIYPLVISVEGVVSNNFNKNIEKLGLPNTILKHAQKATILQTCHIVRKFLNN